MKHYENQKVERSVLKSITCNICGKSLQTDSGNLIGISQDYVGAYESTFVGDMQRIELDVCEECLVKHLVSKFKEIPEGVLISETVQRDSCDGCKYVRLMTNNLFFDEKEAELKCKSCFQYGNYTVKELKSKNLSTWKTEKLPENEQERLIPEEIPPINFKSGCVRFVLVKQQQITVPEGNVIQNSKNIKIVLASIRFYILPTSLKRREIAWVNDAGLIIIADGEDYPHTVIGKMDEYGNYKFDEGYLEKSWNLLVDYQYYCKFSGENTNG